jgi:hypothetical protein
VKLKVPSKKPKLPIFIGGGVIVAAAAVAAVFNIDRITNFAHKQFTSPTEYYQYVEEKSVSELAKNTSQIYDSVLIDNMDFSNKSVEGTVSLELGSAAKSYLNMAKAVGIDVTWLESFGLSVKSSANDNKGSLDAQATLNGTDVLSYNMVMDYDNSSLYMQIPEIAEKYIGIDFSDWLDEYDMEELGEILQLQETSKAVADALPSQDEAQKLIEKYLLVAVNSVGNVSKRSTTVSAQGVSQKCTELKYSLGEKELTELVKNVLKEVKKDSDLEDIIKNAVEASGTGVDADDLYREFVYGIEDMLDDFDYDDYDDDLKIDISIYVNGKGEIIGRTLSFDEGYGDVYTVSTLLTADGTNVGYELNFASGDAGVSLVGNGTYKGGSISGDFNVVYKDDYYDYEYEILDVNVNSLDVKQLKKGYLNGSFEFTVGDDISKIDSSLSVSKDFKLSLTSAMSAGSLDYQLGLEYSGDELGTLRVTSKTGKASSVKVPDSKNTITVSNYYELMDWLETVSLSPFIKNLKSAGVPQDWLDDLEDISDSIENGYMFNMFGY